MNIPMIIILENLTKLEVHEIMIWNDYDLMIRHKHNMNLIMIQNTYGKESDILTS